MNYKLSTAAFLTIIASAAAANATWGTVQGLWNDAVNGLFGTNIALMGGFFLIFGAYLVSRAGFGVEVAIPFGLGLVFLLAVLNLGVLPLYVWTVALVFAAWVTFIALKRFFSG